MKAFSLVEIMVVITIIAMLVALGLPTYQNYMLRSRMSTAKTYVDSYNEQISDYYSAHGTFPTNAELNVSSTIPTSTSQYLYPPYVAYVTFQPQANTSTQCPYTVVTGYFSNYNGDYFSNGSSNYVVYYNILFDNNGTMNQLCAYDEISPSTGEPTKAIVFPSCIQSTTPMGSTSPIMSMVDSACNT